MRLLIPSSIKTELVHGRPRCKKCGGFVNGWESTVEGEPDCLCTDEVVRSGIDWPPQEVLYVWQEKAL